MTNWGSFSQDMERDQVAKELDDLKLLSGSLEGIREQIGQIELSMRRREGGAGGVPSKCLKLASITSTLSVISSSLNEIVTEGAKK